MYALAVRGWLGGHRNGVLFRHHIVQNIYIMQYIMQYIMYIM